MTNNETIAKWKADPIAFIEGALKDPKRDRPLRFMKSSAPSCAKDSPARP